MSRQDKNVFGLVLLVVFIMIAFLFLIPAFRFSCSRVFLHDFLGMAHDTWGPGIFLSDFGIVRMVPLLLMLVLWAAVALWVYHDAERRNLSGLLWGLFVFIGSIIGLIVYLIVRVSSAEPAAAVSPPVTAKCPSCAKPIQETYVACPHCGANLAKKCAHCGKRAELDWKVCPYCGHPMSGSETSV